MEKKCLIKKDYLCLKQKLFEKDNYNFNKSN